MQKTLNLELFKPGFIFEFKGNKHLVIKDYMEDVLVINLDWDNCEILQYTCENGIDEDFINDFDNNFYTLPYVDILEDIIHSDKLRGEEIDTTLLIEEEYDNTVDSNY